MPQHGLIHRPAVRLALARAVHGLTRRQNGWSGNGPGLDPRDLIHFSTVNALAARGLLLVDGLTATLKQGASN